LKCNISDKRRLWESLLVLKATFGEEVWCFLGYFNVVSGLEERRGVNKEMSSAHILEMNLFTILLRQLELEDVSAIGRRFTWYHSNGREMSWIDRILVSEE
jgi:hypothetical protein